MKRKTTLRLIAAAATAAVIGAIAIPAIAGGWGPGQMMQRMHGSEGGFGPFGMGGMADNPVYQSFDADEDGTVTAAELEAGVAALHVEYDADGNGTLSSDEFATLFAEVTRSIAERPFAMLDADNDGQISAEEMAFTAQMMVRMQAWH